MRDSDGDRLSQKERESWAIFPPSNFEKRNALLALYEIDRESE